MKFFLMAVSYLILMMGSSFLQAKPLAQPNDTSSSNHAVVVLYHHDSSHSPAITSIHPEKFIEHMNYLKKHAFNIWPLDKIITETKAGRAIPEFTVAITFDDGYSDIYHNAFAELKKRGFPFTLFINAKKTDAASKSTKPHQYATWTMIKEMAKHGANIQNHTASHTHLAAKRDKETQAQWLSRIQQDIEYGHQRIQEEIGISPSLIAYPYGEYNDEIIQLVKSLGYQAAFGMNSGAFSQNDNFYTLPRFTEGGHYVDTHDFALRVKTKAFPFIEVSDVYPILEHQQSHPTIEFKLTPGKYRLSELACYGVGQGKLKLEFISDYHIKVTPDKAIPAGRSTYNCTMPGYDGRYYWYSHQFNRKLANNHILQD